MGYKRKFTRLPIECQGDLHRTGGDISCKVVDLCEQGMLIRPATPLTVGEELPLEFGLGKSRRIQCTIKIARAAKSDFGAQIVTISPEDQRYLTEYLDDFIANNFGRY
ncbi:MAG: PilZ domain-containing protein [Nitrospiraceae bacterium]